MRNIQKIKNFIVVYIRMHDKKMDMKYSSLIFLIIYLSSIFLFALIYNFMPYEFYHTTTKHEYSIKNSIKDLESELENEIKYNLRTDSLSDIINIGGGKFNLDKVRISNLRIDNFKAQFIFEIYGVNLPESTLIDGESLFLDVTTNKALEKNKIRQTIIINNERSSGFWGKLKLIDLFNKNDYKEIDLKTWNQTGSDIGLFLISTKLLKKLIAYNYADYGFPSETKGNFMRMFYLSAMTITTVGFGDILPITLRARTLIAIEAIWGIIIIGLFLNSLANKIKL
jgi:hypothetical protein